MRDRQLGATLIEMVIFIAIMAVVIGGLVLGFTASLRFAPHAKLATEALAVAKGRMELIRGQRARLGFSGFTVTTYSPCLTGSTHPSCSESTATLESCYYSGTAANSTCTFGSATQCFAGNTDYKCIRVRARDQSGNQLVVLDQAFGNY